MLLEVSDSVIRSTFEALLKVTKNIFKSSLKRY
jgi:hypothetical protein